jgi:DNA invertase Pin-like site-specific DNA recombinase
MTPSQPGSLQPPLTPRIGRILKVLGIARISTEHQDPLSLDDQEALLRDWLEKSSAVPFELVTIAEQGSGECLDRAGITRAQDLVRSGTFDLVLAEDLGRIYRRVHAQQFAELCEDHGTRLITLNDSIDTAQPNWRVLAGFASMRHEMYNADTAQRIRRSHRNRFANGGVIQFVIYGYHKPPGAKSDAELAKDPAAEPIYQEWFRRLEAGASYAEVADWLNGQGIRPGSFCRTPKWTGPMVSRITHNPLLKGLRVRNAKVSRRVNATGRRRCVPAPPGERLKRDCPHLAFFEAAYYDRVIRQVDARNAGYRRKGRGGVDTRAGVPKKRTVWPGQHLRCGVCGRIYYWNGIGSGKSLKCSGNQNYQCWNAAEVNGAMAGKKLAEAILARIEALPDFDPAFLAKAHAEWQVQADGRKARLGELMRRKHDLDLQAERLADAITRAPDLPRLIDKLRTLEADRYQVEDELADLQKVLPPEPRLPALEDLKAAARALFSDLATSDPEVGRLLKALIPDLHACPYQLCGGGAVVLRAKLTLNLAALLPAELGWDSPPQAFRQELLVDLFEPPQPVRYRAEVVARRARGETEAQVARALDITKTAAQRAAALDRLLRELGITDPYQPLDSPPATAGFRRHLHRRYRFEPLNPDSGAAG